LHVRFAFKTFCSAFAIICTASFLLSCGGGSVTPESLTLVPSSFNITVNTATGTVTGATEIQAFLNKTPVDLSTVIFTTNSATVAPGCFGVDQTGVPHCNQGCGSNFAGVITATVTTQVTSTATATISCQFQ
jgi:hypothetical protein